jgi:methyl halide transferase
MSKLDLQYWDNKYKNSETPWDIGYPSHAIISYFQNKRLEGRKILIPGAGNAYEAKWLFQNSAASITVLDISPTVINDLRLETLSYGNRFKCIQGDFFKFEGTYDYIVEHTFFCALTPSKRNKYVKKMTELMSKRGILCGLLFNRIFEQKGPPYGGTISEYNELFSRYFLEVSIKETNLSIPPRMGTEVFIEMKKPIGIN